jgi:branched-chain amino acid transport system permease protein
MSVPAFTVLGLSLAGERIWYWIIGGTLVAAVWLALNLIDSPAGRALRALHGSEVGAQVSGIDATRAKVGVFVISAVFASVAGSMTAHYSGYITPGKVSFFHSIELVTMVVFGGMASTFGAVIGAAALTLLPQLLTVLKEYEMVVLGSVMIATMVFLPRGFLPSLMLALARRRK